MLCWEHLEIMKNWTEDLEPEIAEKVNWLRLNRLSDPDRAHTYCVELSQYAEAHHDVTLLGACYHYLGELAFLQLQFESAITELKLAMLYLEHSDSPKLYISACIVLGNLYHQNAAYETCTDYYLKALRFAEEHHLPIYCGISRHNLADVYNTLQDYPCALDQLKESWEELCYSDDFPFFQRHCQISNRLLTASVLLSLGQSDEALACIHKADELLAEQNDSSWDMTTYYIVKTKYLLLTGAFDKVSDCLDALCEAFTSSPLRAENAPSVVRLGEFIFEHYDLKFSRKLDPLWNQILNSNCSPACQIAVLKLRWKTSAETDPKKIRAAGDQLIALLEKNEFSSRQANCESIHHLAERNRQFHDAQKWMMMANKDTLTGLWNRRHFQTLFQENQLLAINHNLPLAVGLLDVDHFKEYNDHYGHLAGDEVLRQLTDLFLDFATSRLQFGRYGGDEFMFLAVGMTPENLNALFLQLYARLEETALPHLYSSVSQIVTISAGAAYLPPEGKSFDDYLSAADALLYEAKRTGKNCIVIR